MVHALTGGYGVARFYRLVDWGAVGDPRIVCGYSDITALHLALAKHAGWVTFYGPNFLRFTRRKDDYPLTPTTEEWFHRAFQASRSGGSSRTRRIRTCSRSEAARPRRRWWAAA